MIAACNGDPRTAVRALIVANGLLEAELNDIYAAITSSGSSSCSLGLADMLQSWPIVLVSNGSNREELTASKCLPSYPRKRTLLNAVGMSQRCQQQKSDALVNHVSACCFAAACSLDTTAANAQKL
jgi:hypothetical protein